MYLAQLCDTIREGPVQHLVRQRIEVLAVAEAKKSIALGMVTEEWGVNDLMNMAGFCRNCMSKWYKGAAGEHGHEMDYEQARELVYGMPYGEFKDKYQAKATAEQLEKYNAITPGQITK